MAIPDKLRIAYEDFEYGRFSHVGRLPNGSQFLAFVTGAFPASEPFYVGDDWQYKKKWLAVVHQFDADGNHIGSKTGLGGFDFEGQDVVEDRAFEYLRSFLLELAVSGRPVLCDIWVKMFSVEIEGVRHGLFYEQNGEDLGTDEEWCEWVMLEPCDIMFHPPWDSGEYST